MIRKLVFGSPLLTIIPVVNAASPIKDEDKAPQKPASMRPTDLPIYEAPHAEYFDYVEDQKNAKKKSYLKTMLAEPISCVRQQVEVVWDQTASIKNTVKDNYNEFQDRTTWIVKYLREEDNKEQRYGAVAMGGLTGFIFGLRGGIVRRLFYTGIGTGIMGLVCFPEETKGIIKDSKTQARHYINVVYNFCYGVKPGDPQLEVKFPELSFPKDFSEFVDLTVSIASTVKQAVMPPPPKDGTDKPSGKSD